MPTPRSRTAAAGTPAERYWLVVPLLVAAVVVALDVDLPVVRPVLALALLLGVPTLLLARRARFPSENGPARVLYAFGTSLLGLILVALALNTALPWVGVDRPLQPVVLAITALVVDVALLAWRAEPVRAWPRDWRGSLRRLVSVRFELAQTLAVAAVVVSVLGAVRLNNGASGSVALLGHALAAAALLALMARARGPLGRDVVCLALVAAALLLATSLRGWFITGHDISVEYLAYVLTNGSQHWQMSSLQNAYNACLSVNILPTVLAQTTGLSGVVVFKLMLQLVFALVPVLTFLFARRFLSRRMALVASTFTMAFPTFFTDMPYLVRQEIAFFFLALLLLAATEPGRTRVGTRVLVGFFGLGVVVSHYSTTYVLLMALVLGLAVLISLRLLRRLRHRETDDLPARSALVLLSPLLVAFLVVASLAWSGPATHTGGQASKVASQTIKVILGKGDGMPGSSDTSLSLFSGDKASPRERLDLYVEETLEARKQVPAGELLIQHPGKAELKPEIVPAAKTSLTPLGHGLDAVGIAPSGLNSSLRVVGAALMQVFLFVGLGWLLMLLLRPRARGGVPVEVACLSLGSVGALGIIVLIPTLSVDYGVLRAFQQALLVVAPVMALGMWAIVKRLGSRAVVLCAVLPLGLLLTFSGVVPSLFGGYPAQLALSNSGLYYDRYYPGESDAQGIDWLVALDPHTGSPAQIIANKSISTRILAATKNKARVADEMYPTLLSKGAYVFVDSHTQQNGQSTVFYTGDLITYAYPLGALDRRLDLVYSSQQSRIYR